MAFLNEETPESPLHNVTIEIFQPSESGFTYERLLGLIGDRISFVPRYRQRLRWVPGGVANPVWIDDAQFDLEYHVRRSALPGPGNQTQLLDLAARIASRPLDRSRPLWEIYMVEGLEEGRFALLYKTHQALVDGVETVDLGQLLLDKTRSAKQMAPDDWSPERSPTSVGLLAGALKDSATSPSTLLETAATATSTASRRAAEASKRARKITGALAGRGPEKTTPINGPLSQQRRIVTIDSTLAEHRTVRRAHGGSINDIILATVAGGLRGWLMTRAESLAGLRQVRAVVPVSVNDEELEATSLGSMITAHFVDLPVGETSPVVRLHQVSYSFRSHREGGRGVAANRLAGIAGFAPTTFHAIGARVAAEELRHGYQLSVTNVPGPQSPLYAAGAQMLRSYAVPPLRQNHPLAIAVTSYDGNVSYTICADRDWVPDADLLGTCIAEALEELVENSNGGRERAPRGRKRTSTTKK